MRMITAVFSYNRGELLTNCLASIRLFLPESEIVVFDDASDDPDTLEVLARAQEAGARIVATPTGEKQHHGNLYSNMNLAIEVAAARGCEFAHFVQDDMQLLWRRPDLLAHASAVFGAHPEASQLQLHFAKRLGKSRVTLLPRERVSQVSTRPGDLGLFHVPRMRASDIEFGPDERSWGRRAQDLGLEVFATADPIAAMVPWPRSARFGRMRGAPIQNACELLLEPLSEDSVRAFTSRDPARRPWGEDWIVPNGWRCWRPFPHDPSRLEWAYLVVRAAASQRSFAGLWPSRVGRLPA